MLPLYGAVLVAQLNLKGYIMFYRLKLRFRLLFADRVETVMLRRALHKETRKFCR